MSQAVTVAELIDALGQPCRLSVYAGSRGCGKKITVPRVQKPGLALAGFLNQIHPQRLQIIGNTELSYLASLPVAAARRSVEAVCGRQVACLVVTNGAEPPAYFRNAAEKASVPLLGTGLKSSEFIGRVTIWLDERLAPQVILHGVLVEVCGMGVLIRGRSGIGKSEAALELVSRGHRLVADDVVEVRRIGPDRLVGTGSDIIRHHMEIRGLGIINVQDLFGILATMREKVIEFVTELVEWGHGSFSDRLGLDEESDTILGVSLPLVRIPVRPGRSVATIVEVAARNHFLKRVGRHSARELADRVDREIAHQGEHGKE